jgi:hypothetical protein
MTSVSSARPPGSKTSWKPDKRTGEGTPLMAGDTMVKVAIELQWEYAVSPHDQTNK